ncbi:hypothetical protein ACJX0J_010724, partial [Zea mays]
HFIFLPLAFPVDAASCMDLFTSKRCKLAFNFLSLMISNHQIDVNMLCLLGLLQDQVQAVNNQVQNEDGQEQEFNGHVNGDILLRRPDPQRRSTVLMHMMLSHYSFPSLFSEELISKNEFLTNQKWTLYNIYTITLKLGMTDHSKMLVRIQPLDLGLTREMEGARE